MTLSETQFEALAMLDAAGATAAAPKPLSALPAGHIGVNLWNRLCGAGLVARLKSPDRADLFGITPDGARAMAAFNQPEPIEEDA